MLTLDRLAIRDFGPYRGVQEIKFSRDRGVYFFYGPNGRGKTSLHNAFRYALYGKIHGRRGPEAPSDLVNKEARKQLGYGFFETVLDFHDEETSYRLTRRYDESSTPNSVAILERDDVPLSHDDMDKVLQVIAPQSVSQFFLFDGELISKYEALLVDGNPDGDALVASIERVLGLPIVENAKADIKDALSATNKAIAAQFHAHDETRRMAATLAETQGIKEGLQSDADVVDSRIKTARETVEKLDDRIREQHKGERMLGALDAQIGKLGVLSRREQTEIEALAAHAGDMWKALLSASARERLASVEQEVFDLEAELRTSAASTRDLSHLREASDCPVCHRDVPEELRSDLVAYLEHSSSLEYLQSVDIRLSDARSRLKTLQKLAFVDASVVAERDRTLRGTRLEAQECRDEIAELQLKLKEYGEDKLRTLIGERDTLLGKIDRDENSLAKQEKIIAEKDLVIEDLKRKIRKFDVKSDPSLDLKEQVCKDLIQLLGDAIDAYRSKLRRKVEERASLVFGDLSSEPAYRGLRITDSYGLEIIDSDGDIVRRSAGYEHLVALSLIAALQDSAAVRGPVIMDYPFGRLDTANTSNVVAALPQMARQVILLSFDGEFDRDAALRALGPNLVAEFELERISHTHTVVQPRRAGSWQI